MLHSHSLAVQLTQEDSALGTDSIAWHEVVGEVVRDLDNRGPRQHASDRDACRPLYQQYA